jgi:uncharacterized protein
MSMALQFEWDPYKADRNLTKHGVRFTEAETAFNDPNFYTEFDHQHAIDEERYIGIGFSDRGRLLLIVYTLREPFIRIISARPCNAREARFYDPD